MDGVPRALVTRAAPLLGALALAACGGEGGGGRESEREAAPTLPARLAERLATASEEVAASLQAGDGCAAGARAAELRDAAALAVEDGRVPRPLAEPLLAAVERLARQVTAQAPCEAPPVEDEDEDGDEGRGPPDEPPGKAKGKGKGKDKDNGKDKDKDKEDGDG